MSVRPLNSPPPTSPAGEALRTLSRIADRLAPLSTREEVAGVLVDEARQAAEALLATAWFVSPDGKELLSASFAGPAEIEARLKHELVPLDQAMPITQCVKTGEAIWTEGDASPWPGLSPVARELVESVLAFHAPLSNGRQTIGALLVFWPLGTSRAAVEPMANALSGAASRAFERIQLFERERAARREAERSAERLLRLHEVAGALSPTLPESEVFRLVLKSALEIVGASVGNVMVADRERGIVRILHEQGMDPARAALWREFPLSANVPTSKVLRTGVAEWIPDGAAFAAEYPELAGGETPLAPTTQAIVALPIPGGSEVLGALGLGFGTAKDFTLEEKGFLIALTRLCGQAVDRARLFADRARARKAERQQLDRARLLADASRFFAETSADVGELLGLLARRIVQERIAQTCSMWTISPDETKLDLCAIEIDRTVLPEGVPLPTFVPLDVEPYATVARTGFSVAREGVPAPDFADWFRSEDRERHAEYVRRFPVRTIAVVPMRARGRILGIFVLTRYAPETAFTADEVSFVEEIADRAAIGVENIRLLRISEEENRRKDDFLAMLAHELRNPMAPLLAAAAILQREDAPAASAARARGAIDRQVRHLARLVDDLLEVSRISRGKIDLRPERLDLAGLLRDVAADMATAARTQSIDFTVDLPREPIFLEADRTRLAQIATNLPGNAMKFTPSGGRVRLTLENRGEEVEIRVTDSGIGIEPHLLPIVFDAFVQADRSLDRSRGGLGLGLAVVRGLAMLHGGRVSAQSPGLGQGTTMSVVLPRRDPTADAQAEEAAAPVRPRKILVIDDNRDAADTLADLLSGDGHQVSVEYSGLDAMEAIRRFQPEIVLCDIGLPGKDGFAVAREIRADETTRGVKLYAVSGYGAEEDRRMAAQSGFDGHLTKPVDRALLAKVLAS